MADAASAAAPPKKVDFHKKFEEATQMRVEGVALFKEGNTSAAQQKFAFAMLSTKAMLPRGSAGGSDDGMGGMGGMMGGMMGSLDPSIPKELVEPVKDLHCALLNNMASILMNTGKVDRAIDRLSETLSIRPNDTTALARRAKANWKANKLGGCEKDVLKLLELDPTHKEGLKLKKQVDEKNAEYDKKQKNMFKGMFS